MLKNVDDHDCELRKTVSQIKFAPSPKSHHSHIVKNRIIERHFIGIKFPVTVWTVVRLRIRDEVNFMFM